MGTGVQRRKVSREVPFSPHPVQTGVVTFRWAGVGRVSSRLVAFVCASFVTCNYYTLALEQAAFQSMMTETGIFDRFLSQRLSSAR